MDYFVPAVKHVLCLDFLHDFLPPEAIELHALKQLSVDVLSDDFDIVEGKEFGIVPMLFQLLLFNTVMLYFALQLLLYVYILSKLL